MSDQTMDPRPPRQQMSGTSVVAVVVAVVAVLLGFLVLRDINTDSGNTSGTPTSEPVDTIAVTTTSDKPRKTTTTLVTTGFEVLVANASGVGGSAAKMSDQLKAKGFVTIEPLNAAPGTPTQSTTVVYAVPGFDAGAASVAAVLGGADVLPMPTPVPVTGGSLGSASVLVMLGSDLAGKDLPKKKAGN
jgi:hypothetical protein